MELSQFPAFALQCGIHIDVNKIPFGNWTFEMFVANHFQFASTVLQIPLEAALVKYS